ncbi:MAG: rRNA pseudouridine synthase [Leptolyngbya sp. SIO1E4]|nr:rRNA pseudouridine synthase [Leptolyngbya sp. SIO1E4]
MEERLQKVLSQWGIASRRHAEVMIQSGRVRVNGQVAQLGQKAEPERDQIELDGQIISARNRPGYQYWLLNKPKQVMSSCQDPQGRKTVLEFLPEAIRRGQGIHPVGRLDFNSTGALLLTNDGDLTFRLTHPRHHLPKTYRVIVTGHPSPTIIRQWQQGIVLAGRRTLPAKVNILSTGSSKYTELEVVLWEGRNRQIRRVAESLGHPVKRLHRIEIGPIRLGQLAVGQVRALTAADLAKLRHTLDNG